MKKYVDENVFNEAITQLRTEMSQMTTGATYPVGSIFISVVDTNPATLLGFGVWERIKDRFLLSAGDTYPAGSTGGASTHKLTIAELPSHTHEISIASGSSGDTYRTYALSAGALAVTGSTEATGSGQAHNNMPPYIAVYVWKRTS